MCTALLYYTCAYIYSLLNSCGYWTLNKYYYYLTKNYTCVSAQRKGPSVGIFIRKKIRFHKAVQNLLKKNFFVNLLINIVYYVYIDL